MNSINVRTCAVDPTDPAELLANCAAVLGYTPEEEVMVLGSRWEVSASKESVTERLVPGPIVTKALGMFGMGLGNYGDVAQHLEECDCNRVDIYVVSRKWPRVGAVAGVAVPKHVVDEIFDDVGITVMNYYGVDSITPGAVVSDWEGNVVGVLDAPTTGGDLTAAEVGEDAAFALQLARDDVRLPHRLQLGADNEKLADYYGQWQELVEQVREGSLTIDDIFDDVSHMRVVARCLDNVVLRDMTMTAINDANVDTARDLWQKSAHMFDGNARANALACFAIERFHAKSFGVAQAAIAVTTEEQPSHNLTRLLQQALRSGILDDCLQSMLDTAEAVVDSVATSVEP